MMPGALLLLLAATAAPPASPSPQPKPTPTPRPSSSPASRPPLKLDVEQHVEKVMEDHADDLRFEDEVDVTGRAPEAALAQHFREFDLECGPAGGGPPGHVESREARPHMSPYVDMVALAKLLAGLGSKGKGPERYFLYRLNRGETAVFTVREARLTSAEGMAVGGTFELVETFADLGSAVRAWRRMERGFGTPIGSDAAPPPPWATTTCRPRKR
jgi:hypothetical protein